MVRVSPQARFAKGSTYLRTLISASIISTQAVLEATLFLTAWTLGGSVRHHKCSRNIAERGQPCRNLDPQKHPFFFSP